jgi:hypothetical protein
LWLAEVRGFALDLGTLRGSHGFSFLEGVEVGEKWLGQEDCALIFTALLLHNISVTGPQNAPLRCG